MARSPVPVRAVGTQSSFTLGLGPSAEPCFSYSKHSSLGLWAKEPERIPNVSA